METAERLHENSHDGNSTERQVDSTMEIIIDDSTATCNVLDKEFTDGLIARSGISDKINVNHVIPDPTVGMVFESERAAFEYYNQYARKVGFSVRWDCKTVSRKTSVTIARLFVCSKQGYRGDGKIRDLFAKYHREDTRCGCLAFMKIKLGSDDKFRISDCNTTHNHELATPHYVHMLRSQRPRSSPQGAGAGKRRRKKRDSISDDGNNLGIAPATVPQHMVEQVDPYEDASFQVDFKNYLQTRRMTELQKFDAAGLLEYFKSKQAQDPSLFYSFQFDVDEQIANIFWADKKMQTDFMHFGDLVCFDTTYKTNDYGRPLALFFGVNHHKQSIIFGAALLYDETTDSFKWLFRTLIEAMSGKMPTTILTDDSDAISDAVESEFPYTSHRLCVWHLYQKALKNLAHVFSSSKNFDDDFSKCIFDYELEVDFFEGWNSMLVKYGLFENTWLLQKFEDREKWALVYGRNIFCADIKSTQRVECLNKELKSCLSVADNILRFFARFEKFVENKRNQELEANFRMTQSQPYVPPVSIIRHAARVYTSSVFYMFMAEYVVGLECLIKEQQNDESAQIMIVEDGRHHDHMVRVDFREHLLSCSCHKFEFVGVLCGHVLSCITNDLRYIPESYILKRWTRAAVNSNDDSISHASALVEGPKHMHSQRYNLLVRDFIPLLVMAAEDEDTFNCALTHKSSMQKEIETIAKDKSVLVPVTTSGSMYYMTQTRSIEMGSQ
uniref:Protein FAR1-RELATED SEQUENCE n=1 Tax=Anthurium amnicola TaxID=1678845 RepID=A0A1D1Z2I6_9ARAE